MKKRLLASLLIFSMLLSMMPMSAVAAEYTAEETLNTDTQQTEAYTEEATPDAVASENETPTSTDATAADNSDTASEAVIDEQPTAGGASIGIGATALAQTGELQSGAYILNEDLQGDLVIPDGAHVVLDLNGHTLTGSGTDSVITNQGTLTITDNSGTGKGTITGGTGKLCEVVKNGGGIFNEGILTLLNGNIKGNEAYVGGGIFNGGLFCMKGGRITDNIATRFGGGIASCSFLKTSATLLLHGGSIERNEAWCGGGIHIEGDGMMQLKVPAKLYGNTLHEDDGNKVKGNGSDLCYYTSVNQPPYEDLIPYLDIASPATWGIIGMRSWFMDSIGHRYPKHIQEVPNGEVERMVTVGKVNTVTFDATGGLWNDGTTADKYAQLWVDETQKPAKYFSFDDGNNVMPKAPEKPGYIFKGWYTEPNGQGTKLNTAEAVTQNINYYAAWEKSNTQEYTLTYQPNGGSYIPATIHKDGEKVTLSETPTREGYEFVGWCADEDLTQPIESVTMDSDKKVYAAWVQVATPMPSQSVKVTFDANGGQWSTDETQKIVNLLRGEAIYKSIFPQKPSRPGYVFQGWFTEKNNGKEFSPYTFIDKDTIVYARWSEGTEYRLNYETNGGTPIPPSASYQEGTVVNLTNDIKKEGYRFDGWYDNPACEGRKLTSVVMNSDQTVYAKWKEQVSITYKVDGEMPVSVTLPGDNGTVTVDKGSDYTAHKYDELPGWKFNGWYTDPSLSKESRFESGTVSENMTLYGKWNRMHKVIFNATDGTWDNNVKTQSREVESGNSLHPYQTGDDAADCMPAAPKRDGYTFVGWNTEWSGNGDNFSESTKVTSPMTVYAQWKKMEKVHVRYQWVNQPNEYSVLVPSDVHLPFVEEWNLGEVYNAAEQPKTNEPYWTFKGWYEDQRCTTPYKPRAISEDLTLYGKWERAFQFQVTYRIPGTSFEQSHEKDQGELMGSGLRLASCTTNGAFYRHPQANDIKKYLEDKIFIGWKDTVTGKVYSKEEIFKVSFPLPESGYTFDAMLETIPAGAYVLTYDYGVGPGGSVVKEAHQANDKVTLRGGIERPGFTFLGWRVRGSDTLMKEGEVYTMPAKNVTLDAEWQYDAGIDLVFETFGGDMEPPMEYTVANKDLIEMVEAKNPSYVFTDNNGMNVTFDDPELDEFNFVGWYFDTTRALCSVGAGPLDFTEYRNLQKQKIQLLREKIASGNYVGRDLERLRLQLVDTRLGGGTFALEDKPHNPGLFGFYPSHVKNGIDLEDETRQAPLANGDRSILEEVYNLTATNPIPAITELYMEAIYADKNGDLAFEMDVIYDSNNGSGEKVVKEYIETATVPLLKDNPFTDQSKELLGWNTKPDGSGELYKLGAKFKVPVGGTTLYAQWEKDVPVQKYTVSYDLDGGVGADGETYDAVEVTKDSIVKAKKAPTKDGYVFKGWSDGKNTYQPGAEMTVSSDIKLTAQWEKKAELKPTFTVSYDLAGGTGADGEDYKQVSVTEGDKVTAKKAPTKDGFAFKGWSDGKNTYQPGDAIGVSGNITLTAQWEKNSSGGGGGSVTEYYILSYDSNGGTAYKDEKYRKNTVVDLDKVPTRTGYTFTGWYADKDLTDKITSIKMTDDKTVYAGWKGNYIPDDLNSKDHVAYVMGYVDGTVKPNNDVTRAETAAMLYRLLTDERRAEIDTSVNPFSDTKPSDWYAQPVFSMANGQYIAGYEDGTFRGNQSITRAEFVAMLVRFIGAEKAECEFTDVTKNYWAYDDIATATVAGWIGGYPDGSFGPNKKISRAEAMSIINRVLNRGVDADSELLDFKKWPDNPKDSWCYYEVIEATNEHEYTGSRPSEDWTSLSID